MAGTKATCDWNCFLGETFKDKYGALHCKLVEVSNVIVAKSGSGFFFIICSPASFTTLEQGRFQYDYALFGSKGLVCRGLLEGQWRVFVDGSMEHGDFLIGSLPSAQGMFDQSRLDLTNSARYGALTVSNYIT